MKIRLAVALVLPALSVVAPSAQAQSKRLFAGVGIIADNDQTNSRLTETTATSWSVVGGFEVTPHLGVRLMIDAPREVSKTVEGVYPQPSALPIHTRLTRTRRSMTYGVLGDWHGQLAPRLRLALTFGLATVTHDSETVSVREEIMPDGTPLPLPNLRQTHAFPWSAFPVGVEVPVQFGRAIEIVPEFRFFYFMLSDSPEPYILKTGLGIRWRF